MSKTLVNVILAEEASERDRSLDDLLTGLSLADLLSEADALDAFRRQCGNLYQRVRALFFLYAIYRFWVPGENRYVKLRLSSNGMRTIDKRGIEVVLAELRAQGQKV